MFLLTVGYIDMTTILWTKHYYIIDIVYFIYRLFVFFISILSSLLLFYTASWRHKRDYLHASLDILFYIHNKETLGLLYYVCSYNTKKAPIWIWPPQSTMCSYTPDMSIVIIYLPGCDVINFKFNLSNQAVFSTWPKSQGKDLNIYVEKSFKIK